MIVSHSFFSIFFFNGTATTEIYTLSLHDALPIWALDMALAEWEQVLRVNLTGTFVCSRAVARKHTKVRSEEHTSELQSLRHLVCRLLLEKKKKQKTNTNRDPHRQHFRINRANSRP